MADKTLSIAGIAITHPAKMLWPKAGRDAPVSKADLAAYYEDAAERILPHIAGRPLSLVRAPDGIAGKRFFQRHAFAGAEAWLKPIRVAGEARPFVTIDSAQGLVALAQAAVLEIHPWGSKKDDPETPARIVFDLDPAEGVRYSATVAAAKDIGQRLKELGFTPFVKTTGGKGLHVVVAIKGSPKNPATWPDAKSFARKFCAVMEEDAPQRYTTSVAKSARGGKIFLDYLRNDRMATAVAPWSPRARPHAPIAMPLLWDQLRAGLDPLAFTIHKAAALLRRADPWADLDKSAISLGAAREKLGL
jgi:bifunctional non-homologous end joining protein LigD